MDPSEVDNTETVEEGSVPPNEVQDEEPPSNNEDTVVEQEQGDEEAPPAPPIGDADADAANSSTSSGTVASANSIWSTLTSMIPAAFLTEATETLSETRLREGTKMSRQLRVYSIAMLPHPRPDLENGGKMILPPSILQTLTQRTVQLSGPMLFRVTNSNTSKSIHCGVLEFIAEEGRCYMPYWRMHNIGINEGELVTVEVATAEIGKYAQFEPQSTDFLEISDPTALLENTLRNFSCITKGEMLVIHYNDRIYQLKVLETKPTDVINIIECDMDVDFAPVFGQTEEKPEEEQLEEPANPDNFAFSGPGQRLNGKEVADTASDVIYNPASIGQPDFDWQPGNLTFIRKVRKTVNPQATPAAANGQKFTPFQGPGTTLKGGRKEY